MDIPGDIFSEFEDQNTESKKLLSMLKKQIPGGCFELLLNDKRDVCCGENLNLSPGVRDKIVNRTKGEKGIVHIKVPGIGWVYSTAIHELDAILSFTLSEQTPASFMNQYGATIVQLCIELFLSQNALCNEKEFIKTQKKQFKRKISVLEKKYQDSKTARGLFTDLEI
jgi:hypothetical protein